MNYSLFVLAHFIDSVFIIILDSSLHVKVVYSTNDIEQLLPELLLWSVIFDVNIHPTNT